MRFNSVIMLKQSNKITLVKKGLNCFFMDIVTDILFKDKQNLPDDQVIESLIETLMPRATTDSPDTALFDLNLNRTIKSTLFQLLLNFSSVQVHSHLNRILSRSESYLSQNYMPDDLADLKLMFINSIENNFYAKQTFVKNDSKLDMDVELGTEFLEELDMKTTAENIDKLIKVAKIKFIIGTFSRLFGEWAQMEQHADIQNYRDFIEMTEIFITRCKSQWPRYYLIKYVFRMYGQSVLMDSVNSKLFNWIIPRELMLQSEADLQDSYVVCGQGYLKVRNALRDGLVLGSFNKLPFQSKHVRLETLFYLDYL